MEAMIVAALLGAVVGLLLALTGAGGGILAVPLLVFGLHLGVAQAAPIGLIAVGMSAAIAAALGLRAGIVRYRAAGLIGGLGLVVAPLGVAAAQRVPNAPLTVAFAAVLALNAWRTFARTRPQAAGIRAGVEARPGAPLACDPATVDARAPLPCVIDARDGRLVWTRQCTQALAATGAVAGVLSGLLGVGGGFVIVPALTRYTDLPARSIVATSLAVIALVSVGSVGVAMWHGALDWDIAGPFAGGATAALLAGRLVASRVSGARLQQCFAAVSALVAAMLVARAGGWLVMR
ncbi:MAG: sulfite exporter TauE/SafE family protein [Burkholderiaceae bacterium]